MKKVLFPVFVIIAIALLFVFIVFIYSPGPEIKHEITSEVKPGIVIHEAEGESYKILQAEQGFDELSKECISILSSIDGQYTLYMTQDGLDKIKKRNKYVEVIFPDTVNITTKKGDGGRYRVIRMKEAIFMLSGEYYNVIFTHEKNARWVGVWSSERDLHKLNEMAGSFIQEVEE